LQVGDLNSDTIKKCSFKNKYYLYKLFEQFINHMKLVPFHKKYKYVFDTNSIMLIVGTNKYLLRINEDVPIYSYIYLFEKWYKKFYPKFCIDDTEYIIESVFIKNEQFIIKNLKTGKKQLRVSGRVDKSIPISKFLTTVRKIKDEKNLGRYIINNSIFYNDISEKTKVIKDYSDIWLINFFKIHEDYLRVQEVIKISDSEYKIGKFLITLDNDLLRRDLLKLLTY
jgi:hypothetical protein